MQKLGKRTEVESIISLRELERHVETKFDERGRPAAMPRLKPDEVLIGGLNQVIHEMLYSCDSFADMLKLDDAYYQGAAIQITWYAGTVIDAGDDDEFIMIIIT